MDRRRAAPKRPASSEEVDYWSHVTQSLATLSTLLSNAAAQDTVGRVNRLIAAWSQDDQLSEGFDGMKNIHKKLVMGLNEIKSSAERDVLEIDATLDTLSVLIALRQASESTPQEKRPKRPRAHSPSGTSTPSTPALTSNGRGGSIPAGQRGSVGPPAREAKGAAGNGKAQPLQEGRMVAFHPPSKPGDGSNGDPDDTTWILAKVTKCLNYDKNRYQVQDVEPQEDGQPGLTYSTNLKSIIPLPDPDAAPSSSSHLNAYPTFVTGSTVMALYPDTSCFYRAEVIASPKDLQPAGRNNPASKVGPMYKLKFEDDDDQEHTVSAQWVVEFPRR